MEQVIRLLEQALVLLRAMAAPTPANPPTTPSPTTSPRQIAWGAKVSPEFKASVLWIEEALGIRADWLMAVMAFESGLNPKARNPQSSASGLIQFMRATAVNLGTTIEAIREMDAIDQLNLVYKYFRPYKGKVKDLADCYMVVLWPAAVGKPLEHPIFVKGDSAYAVNVGLDKNRDQQVTKAEAAAKVAAKLQEGLEPGNIG